MSQSAGASCGPLKYIGLDGCKSGWFYFGVDPNDGYRFGVLRQFSEISEFLRGAKLILVDIPIGLPSAGQPERLCDKEARKVISPRGSSVFPAPARSALGKKSYTEGSEENYRVLGRRLSKQSWNIAPRIREVDDFLRSGSPGEKIREMHPEVAFQALNGCQPLLFSKKDGCGAIERFQILRRYLPITEEQLFDIKRSMKGQGVATDDILDAIVGAVTARQGRLATLPEQPLLDDEKLPMEIVYSSFRERQQDNSWK